ncbi:hypothetical protein [Hymenobacter sp. AT01-02]|uniref:hypothetical protein n=1 Tax=Hymenobacter sp. AT01-02 TaxID=1571877 RepID=UPI0005F26E69|nr:hypothetical protein [Hymenobacter sp. AT01-02]
MRYDYESEEEEKQDGFWQGFRVALIIGVLGAILYPLAEWVASRWQKNLHNFIRALLLSE